MRIGRSYHPAIRARSLLRRAGIVALGGVLAIAVAWAVQPSVEPLLDEVPRETSYMRARGQARRGEAIALERISPLAVCAVIKAEDRRFFAHGGFDWAQVRRAVEKFVIEPGRSMGASTISQQLARNLFLDASRSATRKLREAMLTIELERVLGKRRILEIYLNVIEWGDDVWGIAAASERYFAKTPDRLDAFESAFLAGLIAAPAQELKGRPLRRARRVQLRVLHQLYFAGLIDREEYEAASARVAEVASALESGVALEVALTSAGGAQCRGDVRRPGTRLDASPLLRERAIDEACGLERELRETELHRKAR